MERKRKQGQSLDSDNTSLQKKKKSIKLLHVSSILCNFPLKCKVVLILLVTFSTWVVKNRVSKDLRTQHNGIEWEWNPKPYNHGSNAVTTALLFCKQFWNMVKTIKIPVTRGKYGHLISHIHCNHRPSLLQSAKCLIVISGLSSCSKKFLGYSKN